MPLRTPFYGTPQPVRLGANYYYGAGVTITNLIPPANQLSLAPIDVGTACSLTALAGEVNTAGTAGAVFRLGVYFDDGTGTFPGALLVDASTIDGTSQTAQSLTAGMPITLASGRYWVGGANQGSPGTGAQMRCVLVAKWLMASSTASASSINTGAAQNGVSGALPANFTGTYGVSASPPRIMMRLT